MSRFDAYADLAWAVKKFINDIKFIVSKFIPILQYKPEINTDTSLKFILE
jgi:hypothetical protein